MRDRSVGGLEVYSAPAPDGEELFVEHPAQFFWNAFIKNADQFRQREGLLRGAPMGGNYYAETDASGLALVQFCSALKISFALENVYHITGSGMYSLPKIAPSLLPRCGRVRRPHYGSVPNGNAIFRAEGVGFDPAADFLYRVVILSSNASAICRGSSRRVRPWSFPCLNDASL